MSDCADEARDLWHAAGRPRPNMICDGCEQVFSPKALTEVDRVGNRPVLLCLNCNQALGDDENKD